MPSQKKVELANSFKQVIQSYPSFFVTQNNGMTVAEITDLRTKLRENGAVYQVVKNNVFKIALNNEGINGLDEVFVGPNAILFTSDAVGSAKVLKDFVKDKERAEKLKIKGGYTEGQVVDTAYVTALAELPSKEELLSKFLGTLKNPLNRMVRVLNNPLQKLAIVLNAVAETK